MKAAWRWLVALLGIALMNPLNLVGDGDENQLVSVTVTAAKLKVVRRAAEYSFPTAGLDQMLAEIEQRY